MGVRNNTELALRYQDGDEKAFDKLVLDNMGLVHSTVKHFVNRGTDYDDLVQIGSLGLIKAAKSYDPCRGFEFSTYAFSMISGELKRHFRDDGLIKISRNIKKNCAYMLRMREEYISEHGSEPSVSYLAEKCGIEKEEAVFCLGAMTPIESTNTASDGKKSIEEIGGTDNIEQFIEKYSLHQAISMLSETERKIISLRFERSMTQNETAKILGMNQVKISRTEKKILEKLRQILRG